MIEFPLQCHALVSRRLHVLQLVWYLIEVYYGGLHLRPMPWVQYRLLAICLNYLWGRYRQLLKEVEKRTERPILEHKSDQRFLSLFLYSHYRRLGTVLMLAQSVFEKSFKHWDKNIMKPIFDSYLMRCASAFLDLSCTFSLAFKSIDKCWPGPQGIACQISIYISPRFCADPCASRYISSSKKENSV